MANVLKNNLADILFEAGSITKKNATVIRFRGREAVSEVYRFVIELASTDFDLDLESVVGSDATLTLVGTTEDRLYHGIVSRVEMMGQSADHADYRVELVPRIWLLTHRVNSRIFQGQTVPQIIASVLEKGGIPKDGFTVPTKGYDPRDYCVQYNETDFAFISRLAEEEGIFYYFEHDSGDHHLVMADNSDVHVPIPGGGKIDFKDTHGGPQAEEFVYRLTLSEEMRPGMVSLWDYNFEKPSTKVKQEKKYSKDTDLEVYSYPGDFIDDKLGKKYAGVRLSEYNVRRTVARGKSSCRRFLPGYLITLSKHPRSSANGEYLITAVEHSASQKDAMPGSAGNPEMNYDNVFVAIPSGVAFRPPRITPRPRIIGTQTAVVTGGGAEEIHTDKYGRIKVKFHWDRSAPTDDTTSCWVPVMQKWAGAGWGSIFIPRVGMEVVVEHRNGDPDCPIVVGCVYNGENQTPYPLPGEKTKSTIRTNSSTGGGGYNELRFEDAAGNEEIYTHAQKDYNIVVENDRTKRVGHDETLTVVNDQAEEVKHNASLLVGANRTKEIKENQDETVGGNMTLLVKGNMGETVNKSHNHTVDENYTLTVKQNTNITVDGKLVQVVKQDMTEEISGATSIKFGGDLTTKVDNNESATVKGNQTTNVTGSSDTTVDGAMSLVGKSTLDISADGETTFHGQKITITSDSDIILEAGSAKIEMKSGKVKITGSEIELAATGNLKLSGSQVTLN